MAKSKRKKNKLIGLVQPKEENKEGSITNLPEKCIQMNVSFGSIESRILLFEAHVIKNSKRNWDL